jgi:group I intron endonuclease
MIIYKITNKIDGLCYIGQTKHSIQRRWTNHCSKFSNSRCLKDAIEKHGQDNFTIAVIGTYDNREDLNNAEAYFIEWHNCLSPNGYNLNTGGSRGSEYSEETKKRMSHPSNKKGIPMSEESRQKMSTTRKGKLPWNAGKTGVFSKEVLQRMSDKKKGNTIKADWFKRSKKEDQ